MSNQTYEQTEQDPLAIALAAIDRFDRARLNGDLVAERYDVAALRTAYATASELRRHTHYLNSIESWLIDISGRLEAMQEASRDPA